MSKNHEMEQDEILGKIYDNKLFKRLIFYLKPYILHIIIALLLLLINTVAELYLPLLTKLAVDEHIIPDNRVLKLDKEMFERFSENADLKKFDLYYYKGNEAQSDVHIVISSSNQGFINKEFLSELRSKGYYPEEKSVIFNLADIRDDLILKIEGLYTQISESHCYMTLGTIYNLPVPEILALRGKSISVLKMIGLVYLGIVIIRFFIAFFQLVITTIASQKAMHDLRSELFFHLERMPVSFFDKNPVGRLVTRVTNDIRAIDEMLTSGVITIIQDIFTVIAIMVLMLILNWQLALVSFAVLPFVFWLITIFRRRVREAYRAMRKWLAQVNATIAEHISGVKIIQLFNQYSHKEKSFDVSNINYYDASMKQLKIFAIFRPLIGASRHIATAIILWYAGGQILQNIVTIGLFMAFISYMEKLYEPINNFSEKFNILQGAMAGAERIFELMDKPRADYRENCAIFDNIVRKGEPIIEFKNVWHSYSEPSSKEADMQNNWVLKNISFKVKPGEKVALVGHTGSGKTTIVNLILNMYQNQMGDIFINNNNINEYRLDNLREHIGIVQQDVFLFSGNIRDNIILNNKNITDEQVNKITEYVNVASFIDSLPGKLDEPVQERGSTFSVGQRQLISFARVLAYDPAIFILDEATSNIDTETELLIQDAIFKIMENRTSIIIAHRLSTIQFCDRIIVMHKGEIAEIGSHQELLKNEGVYYNLYRLQYETVG